MASFPLLAFIFSILPLIIGMILGNLDEDMREFLGRGVDVLIPFFALAIGAGINLTNVLQAGLSGIVLGVLVVIVTGVVLFFLDRLTGGKGVAGVAASSTAGNAAAVPVAVAALYPAYQEIASLATLQVTAAVIVTAVLTPIVTAWVYKRVGNTT
nr:2-keto-3-deoxygluconate permease [Cohnella kolymensis]